jgi:hypothetical protein
MRVAVMVLGLVVAVATASAEDAKEWLGEYKGSAIPGFVIRKAMYAGVSQFGTPTTAVEYHEVIAFLKKQCIKSKGVALTNVSLMMTVGPMHSVDPDNKRSGLVQVLGKEIYASGDCVLSVEVSH